MTDVVVEVGPGTVKGPNEARPEWVSAALECIDDDIALLDDRPVPVQDVWRDVMSAAAGDAVDTLVVVHPAWWPSSRLNRVQAAADMVATSVVALQRMPILRHAVSDPRTAIVELSAEFVVVSGPGVSAAVLPRRDDATDAEAVAAAVGAAPAVLVDAPVGMDGAELLRASIADRLRDVGIAVRFTDADFVRRTAAAMQGRQQDRITDAVDMRSRMFRPRRGAAVLAGVLAAVALCGGLAAATRNSVVPAVDMPLRLLVEGRVGVMVPAVWTAQRITSGPGSARVQIVSPSDSDVVLHVTQSTGSPYSSLAVTADSLRAALGEEPDGIFVDFNPSDHRADKAAVTYREIRPGHHVAWAVLVDGTVRIAIGCQSGPGREHLVRDACDHAIRSAHAII